MKILIIGSLNPNSHLHFSVLYSHNILSTNSFNLKSKDSISGIPGYKYSRYLLRTVLTALSHNGTEYLGLTKYNITNRLYYISNPWKIQRLHFMERINNNLYCTYTTLFLAWSAHYTTCVISFRGLVAGG